MKPFALLLALCFLVQFASSIRIWNCWRSCGNKGGNCNACGENKACCRRGWGRDPVECKDAYIPCTNYHCCALKKGQDEAFTMQSDQLKITWRRWGPLKAFTSYSTHGGSFRKVSDSILQYSRKTDRNRPFQWIGYSDSTFANEKLIINGSVKFYNSVPPKSSNFGVKVYGTVHNDWVDQCTPNQWCDFTVTIKKNKPSGDHYHVILIFDTVNIKGTKVDIRKFDVGVEYGQPPCFSKCGKEGDCPSFCGEGKVCCSSGSTDMACRGAVNPCNGIHCCTTKALDGLSFTNILRASSPKSFAETKNTVDGTKIAYNCDFDTSNCGIEDFKRNTNSSHYQWNMNSTQLNVWRRAKDLKGVIGQFASVIIEPKTNKQAATFESKKTIFADGTNCLEFNYIPIRIRGWKCDAARFTVKVVCGSQERVVFEDKLNSQDKQYKWQNVVANINNATSSCKLVFEADKPTNSTRVCTKSVLVVDNIKVHYSVCPSGGTVLSSALTCPMERNTCAWNSSGEVSWKFNSEWRGTDTILTGPQRNKRIEWTRVFRGIHTGYFAYIDASLPNFPKKSSVLRSPEVINSEPQCFRVFLNMYGKSIGVLKISVISDGKTEVKVAESGNQGEDWFERKFNLPVNKKYQVVIEAKTGDSQYGDIVIDNIVVDDGKCEDNSLLGKCDFSTGEVGGSCLALQSSQCRYDIRKEDIEGAETSIMAVNLNNCSTGERFYIDILAAKVSAMRKACVSFKYRMKGPRICHMRAYHKRSQGERITDNWSIGRVYDTGEDSWETQKLGTDYFTISHTNMVTIMFDRFSKHHCQEISIANLQITDGIC